jgi:hypothetical protein
MNHLAGNERAAKVLFHDQTVFRHISITQGVWVFTR